jgi:hypothetical protein
MACRYKQTADVVCIKSEGSGRSRTNIPAQHYDVALRRWYQVEASTQLYGQPTYMTEEVRKRALDERHAAKARLTMHQEQCNKCSRKPYSGT